MSSGAMSDYTIVRLDDVPDILGEYPGEMRFLTSHLGSEQIAVTHRRMPQHTGGKGGYGHRHKEQEEIYFLVSGKLQAKLDDEVVEIEGPAAVRCAPQVARSFWNAEPEDAHVVIISRKIDDPENDAEIVENFWPE
jgi:mannose-6-phosphate isomerase-like protein (cupin superfamily)